MTLAHCTTLRSMTDVGLLYGREYSQRPGAPDADFVMTEVSADALQEPLEAPERHRIILKDRQEGGGEIRHPGTHKNSK